MTAESAQSRKAGYVTRAFPILWVGSGDETSETRLTLLQQITLILNVTNVRIKVSVITLILSTAIIIIGGIIIMWLSH